MNTSNQPNQMFQNPFLEKMSRTNVWVVITAFVLISAAVFSYGIFKEEMNVFMQVGILILGFLFFTLSEYLIHRYAYHSGEYTDNRRWQFKIHGFHHAFPKDKERLAMPLPLAILLAVIIFSLYRLLIGKYAWFFFPGFIFGFAYYQFIHYIIHTRRPPKNIFRYLWKHHFIHHYQDDDLAFGVTNPFWDIVFGTMPSIKRNNKSY